LRRLRGFKVRVIVRPHSIFRDRLGGDVILEFSEKEVVVKNILDKLESMYKISAIGVKPVIIVNDEIVTENYVVRGDSVELHLVPPFSGG
jgi:molybdopterin converting factor small subunit